MNIEQLYMQSIHTTKYVLAKAVMAQENQLRLPADHYDNADDYEQEKQENSAKVYELSVYILHLEKLKTEMEILGINLVKPEIKKPEIKMIFRLETKDGQGTTDWGSEEKIVKVWSELVSGSSIRLRNEAIHGDDGKRYVVVEGCFLELYIP